MAAVEPKEAATTLTKQELKIVRLMIAGFTLNSIARQLNLHRQTIFYHRNNICRKVNATCTVMLVAAVIAREIISQDEVIQILESSPNYHPFFPGDCT